MTRCKKYHYWRCSPWKWRERGRQPVKGVENDRRGRPREHPNGTSDRILRNFRLCMRAPHPSKEPWRGHVTFNDVISGEKAPLGRIIRNFRLRMRKPFHPHPPSGSRDRRSLPVAMVFVLLYYILYYNYSKKKALETEKKVRGEIWACGEHTSGHVTDVTSGQGQSRDFR